MDTHAEARQGTQPASDDTSRLDGMDESHGELRHFLGHPDTRTVNRGTVTFVEHVETEMFANLVKLH